MGMGVGYNNKELLREMDREEVADVVIIGAGISGLATALALHRVGIRPLVLEKAKELRATGAAMSLFPNAWHALDALGVSHKLTPLYKPIFKTSVTKVSTGAIQEISIAAGNNDGPRPLHRRALLEALASELPVDSLRFSCKITGFESLQSQQQGSFNITAIHMEDGTTIKTKILIGCDGVHLMVARWLGLKQVAHSGRWAVRGLATYAEGHHLQQQVCQFVDEGKRAGVVPLNDKELYWFITFQSTPTDEVAGRPELIKSEVLDNYAKNFPPKFTNVAEHAELSTLSLAPLLLRYPWDIVFGNLSKGNVTVAGDAMHPMTPDLGQGGCSALEDAVVIGRYIGESFIKNQKQLVSEDVTRAIQNYVNERKWRVAALVAGSYLSGWAQGGSSWFKKFIRDSIFYKLVIGGFLKFSQYDCGRLPSNTKSFERNPSKMD